ncbi:MAG: hypothetical protein Q9M82_04865 [Mariprofundus sp.]|nr:hypothetical protein [Mariprofundus sp.]
MMVCSSCGVEMQDKKKLCMSCIEGKINATWKRQMRIYSISVVLGIVLLVYDISEVRALPHDAAGIPPYLLGGCALGGLALLGGLFGLALAAFFNVWHRKKAA